jgi:hypothetical protein
MTSFGQAMPEYSSMSGFMSDSLPLKSELTGWSVLKGEPYDISESLEGRRDGVSCTHVSTQPFRNNNFDATIALPSIPMTLLENFRMKYRKSQWFRLAGTFGV